jgi:cobalamin biosynthesis protein CbiD
VGWRSPRTWLQGYTATAAAAAAAAAAASHINVFKRVTQDPLKKREVGQLDHCAKNRKL